VTGSTAETIVEVSGAPVPAPQPATAYLMPAPPAQTAAVAQSTPPLTTVQTSLTAATEHPGQRMKRWWPILAALILLAVAFAGTKFFLGIHERPPQQTPPYTANAPPPESAMPNRNTPPPPGGAGNAPAEFYPATLDPGRNTHLSLDLGGIPPPLTVALEMDGKIYWSGPPGNQSSHERLLVPPGRHRFCVIVSGGGEPKISNIVSAAFDPRMHLNLMVRVHPRPNANAVALDPAARVIATLKPSGPPDATVGHPGERLHTNPQNPPGGEKATQD
jgi:hypothetical protein